MHVNIPLQRLYLLRDTIKIHKWTKAGRWDLEVHFRIRHSSNDYYRLTRPWSKGHQFYVASGKNINLRSIRALLRGAVPGAQWEQQLASQPSKMDLGSWPINYWKNHDGYRGDVDRNTFV